MSELRMTEIEWISELDYSLHLRFLENRLTARKARLLAVAFCRSIWRHYTEPHLQRTVELAECFADGNCSGQELEHSRQQCRKTAIRAYEEVVRLNDEPVDEAEKWSLLSKLAWVSSFAATTQPGLPDIAHRVAEIALQDPSVVQELAGSSAHDRASLAANANAALNRRFRALILDLAGNPFSPVSFASDWRTSTALALARGMYESRDFSAMPILADSLQDSGCWNDAVLEHCRRPGAHVRGCWVLDHVLDLK